MDIQQIAKKLNEKAIHYGFHIATLPNLRKEHLKLKSLSRNIFTWQTIKNSKDKFAFHNGGRTELQFNFGEENINGNLVTRFALCFSLDASRSYPELQTKLQLYKDRFNICIKLHNDLFDGFTMWYYRDEIRSKSYIPKNISDELFQPKTFIAIGNIIQKSLSELSDSDLLEILRGFDKLLPIYQFCVLQKPFPIEELNSKNNNDNVFVFRPSSNNKDRNIDEILVKGTQERQIKIVEVIYLHNIISHSLSQHLKKLYDDENVALENPTGYSTNRIDIVVKDNDDFIFYEIKTYPLLQTSVREAIGQLMEYSLWTNHKKAKKLIVITQPHSDIEDVKIYLKYLRETYNLPLYYQSYDYERDILSEMV